MQTIMTSREFNQDTSGAKRAAQEGPVFITDRGQPAHVLMSIEEYQRLTGSSGSIVDLLAMAEAGEVELEIPRVKIISRPADLS